MPTIIVPLADIITDEANPIDLTALPEAEAIAAIKDIYGFLADSVQVTISDGIATIALDDAKANQANQAQRTLARASEQAARGRYNRAIPLYQEVLRTLPDHTEARRELAMALLETGSPAAAKKHLIRVLQLDPNDAWAYLLLGNLYYQHEDDLGSADRYYISALDLAPEDPYILNSAAVVKAKRGDYTTAEQMFQQAITLDPAFPNPRHGLALCYHHQGADAEALGILEQLFDEPASDDPRHAPVYAEARRLYLELIRARAVAARATNLAALQDIFAAYRARTGLAVALQHDPGLNTDAKIELAWRYNRDHHVIKYKDLSQATEVYLLTHEFEHILLDEEARAAGRAWLYAATTDDEAAIQRILDKDLRRIRKRADIQPAALERFIASIIDGQRNQLYNMPLDLIIDGRIREKYPFAHDSQLVFMQQEQEQNQRILTDRNLQNLTPTRILQANIALNGAQALQLDAFTHGITDHAARYRQSGMLGTAERIYAYYQDHVAHWQPGAEHDLVDLVAGELNMTEWYTWLPGSADAHVGPDTTPGNTDAHVGTDPDFLSRRDVQMPVVMYMVGALKRYADMTPAQISQVAGEIGLLGQTGIDYTDSTQKYTLRFLPDEPFSGLQLLAIMYVGYQLLDPTLDTGLPFADAYRQAQSMYQAGM